MHLKDQIRLHKEISQEIVKLEEQKKALSLSIMQTMTGKSLQLDGFLVKRFSRLSISTTIDQARPLDAIKLEEVVDKDKIKTLYKSGLSISGVKEVEYIQVSLLEEK